MVIHGGSDDGFRIATQRFSLLVFSDKALSFLTMKKSKSYWRC